MNDPVINARVLRAAGICRERNLSQAQIAEAVGASQSQVSRILSGRGSKQSRLMEEVCLYLERQYVGVTAEAVRAHADLIEAVRTTWDGSESHAQALSTVIRSLTVLRRGNTAGAGDEAGGRS
jgi:transcriptional regulator with XRE-family HTH domain